MTFLTVDKALTLYINSFSDFLKYNKCLEAVTSSCQDLDVAYIMPTSRVFQWMFYYMFYLQKSDSSTVKIILQTISQWIQ